MRCRIASKKEQEKFKLETAKEDAKEFVCFYGVEKLNLEGFRFTDECDLIILRDDVDRLVKINEAIDKSKSIEGIRKAMLKHFTEKEIKNVAGV